MVLARLTAAAAAAATLLLAPLPSRAQAVPTARLTAGELAFDASATIGGRFSGTTREGEAEVTGGESVEQVRGWVRFAARSLRTGIGQRDRHMWESLEAERHPTISFEIERVEPTGARGDTTIARVHGQLTLRGVRRPVVAPVEAWRTANGFRVRTRFPIDLGDFQVGGLRRMMGTLRVSEDVTVRADLTFAGS